jgi:MFS family permease
MVAHPAFVRATAVNFFFFAGLNGFVLLPLYITAQGGTEVEVGLVMGLYSAVGIVCQPLVGPWTDAVGRRPFMIAGVVLVVGSAVIATLTTAVPGLALVRALQGVGFSAFFVANYSYVIDLVPPAQRGWALGIYGNAGMVTTALAPLFGEWVIRRFGFHALFVISAVIGVITLALAWSIREQRRDAPPPVRALELARSSVADVLQRHMLVTLFFGLGTGTVFAFLPTFGVSLGVTTLALFYTAYAVAAMGVRIFGGRLIDTRGRRAVIVPSMFLQAIAVAVLAALALAISPTGRIPALPGLFLAGLLGGAGHGFLYPGLAAIVADHAPEARRGAVVGIFSAVFLVGNTSGAMTFGIAAHALGYGPMWSILAALLLLGAIVSLGLSEDRASG